MMRVIFFILFQLILCLGAKCQTFNRFYAIDFHSPPYNYLPNGYAENTFEVINSFGSTEFLLFGDGVLKSPTETSFPWSTFSMRFNEQGEHLSSQIYDLEETSELLFNTISNNGMTQNHEGKFVGIIVTRNSISPAGQISNLRHYLTRFDQEGNLLDSVLIQYPSEDIEFRSYVLREDPRDSTYIIIGGYRTQEQMNSNGGLLTGMITKIDTLGNLLWWNDVPNTSYGNDVIMAPFGQYVATFLHGTGEECFFNSSYDNTRIVVCTFNSTLIEKDRIVYDNPCGGEWGNLAMLDNNTVVVAGSISSTEELDNAAYWGGQLFSQKIEIDNIGWMYEEGDMNIYFLDTGLWSSDFKRIECDQGFLLSGTFGYKPTGLTKGYMLKLNNELEQQWFRGYRYFDLTIGQPLYQIMDVTELSDCGYLITGQIEHTTQSLINNQVTPWLVRTDEYGCLEPGCQLVGTEELAVGLDGTVKIYPNPADEWMQLEFTFPEHLHSQFSSEDFRLNVYSVDGKLMLEEMIPREQILQQGRKEINTSAWPEGGYLIHLSQGHLWIDSVQGVIAR